MIQQGEQYRGNRKRNKASEGEERQYQSGRYQAMKYSYTMPRRRLVQRTRGPGTGGITAHRSWRA